MPHAFVFAKRSLQKATSVFSEIPRFSAFKSLHLLLHSRSLNSCEIDLGIDFLAYVSDFRFLQVVRTDSTCDSETYGPFTACYAQDSWKKLSLDERARKYARQGFAFLTSEPARVVYPPKEGDPLDAELKDVPADGKTVGEIVMRGNIAMKEVCQPFLWTS